MADEATEQETAEQRTQREADEATLAAEDTPLSRAYRREKERNQKLRERLDSKDSEYSSKFNEFQSKLDEFLGQRRETNGSQSASQETTKVEPGANTATAITSEQDFDAAVAKRVRADNFGEKLEQAAKALNFHRPSDAASAVKLSDDLLGADGRVSYDKVYSELHKYVENPDNRYLVSKFTEGTSTGGRGGVEREAHLTTREELGQLLQTPQGRAQIMELKKQGKLKHLYPSTN